MVKEKKRGSTFKNLSDDQLHSLERRLDQRPDQNQLREQNILKEGGRLAAAKQRLEREINQDNIGRAMGNRPDVDSLHNSGIISSTHVAPSLQAAAKKLERSIISDQLNQKLYTRHDPEELKQHGILKADDVAPGIRGAKVRLEHAITRDQIGHLLESRPEPEELEDIGILPKSHVASSLQEKRRRLEHHMTVDKVGHLLERRSDLNDLLDQNILQDTRVASSIQGTQKTLERNLARANLYHALARRPSLDVLRDRGVYQDVEDPYYNQSYDGYGAGGQQYYSGQSYEPTGYQRRSKNFHLTRILLKFVASMAEAGEISLQQKGVLKDLIVDQDSVILSVAETFDAENDINDFKDSLIRLATRR